MANKLSLLVQFDSPGLSKLTGGLKSLVGAGKSGAGALRALQQDSARLKREIVATGKELRTASGNVTHLVDREKDLAAQLERTNSRIEQQKRLLAIDARADRLRSRGEALQARGRENMIGGAAMAAPLFLVAKSAATNEKAMALMGQKLELNKKQTDALGRSLLRAATDAKQLPDNILGGADFLASKGLKVAEIEAMMPIIGRFGTAWDADVTDTAKAAYANFLSLNVPLAQTSRALEMMAVAGNAGGFEVRDMAAEFPKLTSKIATLGSTGLPAVADLSAALQVLEAKTGDGATAANNLNNVMSFATSKTGIDRFKKLGIDLPAALKKAAAEGRSPLETLASLTKQVTGGDEMKIGQIFSDEQARQGITALIQSEKDYLAIRKQALEARGMTDKEFERMAGTSSANMNVLMGSLQGLSVTLGTHLLPSLISGTQWLTRVTTSIGAWAQANPRAASTLMSVAKWIVIAKIGLGGLQFAFGGTLKGAASAWRTIAKWKEMGKLARAFGIVKGAGLGLARAVMFVGRAMLLNPIGLAVTALGVAAYLIWKHWDKIKGAFAATKGWLTTAWSKIGAIFSAGVAFVGRAVGFVKRNALLILPAFGPIGVVAALIIRHWARIKSAFANGVRGVGDAVGRGLAFMRGFIGNFVGIGRAIIDGLVSGIRAAPGKIWAALKSIIGGAWRNAKSFLGINSPSRLFMQMGGFVTDGLALGIDRGRRAPSDSARRMAQSVASGFALPRSPFALAGAPSAPLAGPAGRMGGGGITISGDIVIQLTQQPGEDATQLAQRLMREIRAMAAREARGSYEDR